MQRKKIAIISTASRGGGSETFLRGLLPPLLKESDNVEYHLFVAKSRKEHYLNISNMIVIHPISDEILDNHLPISKSNALRMSTHPPGHVVMAAWRQSRRKQGGFME